MNAVPDDRFAPFRSRRMARDGFTLIEMMIVVVIVGVLAAVAIPAFSSYIYKSRAAEAPAFLGEIKQRQEAYRSEFGIYAAAPVAGADTYSTFTPASNPNGELVAWPGDATWSQLGASPDGFVRFQYATVSGPPNGGTRMDFWFTARAIGNLNGDATSFTVDIDSAHNQLAISSARGWE